MELVAEENADCTGLVYSDCVFVDLAPKVATDVTPRKTALTDQTYAAFKLRDDCNTDGKEPLGRPCAPAQAGSALIEGVSFACGSTTLL